MFLALIHEGEVAMTPSRREVLILGTLAGKVLVRYLDTLEEFSIAPRYLQPCPHLPAQPLAGARITSIFFDEATDGESQPTPAA